jgi:hypothetical protein
MTEKLKLTQRQGYCLENISSKKSVLKYHMEGKFGNESYNVLLDLTFDELAKALYVPDSYEVESDYKVGEWAKYKVTSLAEGTRVVIGVITNIAYGYVYIDNSYRGILLHRVEVPTPEEIKGEQERRAWAKIGREVNDFRVGDRYVNYLDNTYTIVSERQLDRVKQYYLKGEIKGIIPEGVTTFFEGVNNGEN